ncbi:hypothetical protein, partial [Erwinia amylovora]
VTMNIRVTLVVFLVVALATSAVFAQDKKEKKTIENGKVGHGRFARSPLDCKKECDGSWNPAACYTSCKRNQKKKK